MRTGKLLRVNLEACLQRQKVQECARWNWMVLTIEVRSKGMELGLAGQKDWD